MDKIPGHRIPKLQREIVARLEQNIRDQEAEIRMVEEALLTMKNELDLALVTLALVKHFK